MGIFEKNLIWLVVKWLLNWLASNEKNKTAAAARKKKESEQK